MPTNVNLHVRREIIDGAPAEHVTLVTEKTNDDGAPLCTITMEFDESVPEKLRNFPVGNLFILNYQSAEVIEQPAEAPKAQESTSSEPPSTESSTPQTEGVAGDPDAGDTAGGGDDDETKDGDPVAPANKVFDPANPEIPDLGGEGVDRHTALENLANDDIAKAEAAAAAATKREEAAAAEAAAGAEKPKPKAKNAKKGETVSL